MGKKLVFKCENLLPFYTENFLLLELHPPIINAGGLQTKKYISNGKKNLSCKWMFFPILTIDIVEEIASGIETEYRQTFDT